MTTKATDLTTKPLANHVAKLIERILEENPMHRRFIQASLENITAEELAQLGTYVAFCQARGLSISYLAECYLTIVEDTIREQIYFLKHKKYRHKTFADVAGDVYFNAEYMHSYMYGLAITAFFWPNHLGVARFFNRVFPRDKRGRYLEIGPGHGYYFMTAMRDGSFDEFLGVDLSAASIEQTEAILRHFHPELKNRFRLEQADFLEAGPPSADGFDAIVMGEVLEHVERPERFLQRIVELARPDAFIYVTTCINAPAVDHIYLWRTADELEEMIKSCGLTIKQSLRLPYEGKSMEEAMQERLSINVAYVLEKAR